MSVVIESLTEPKHASMDAGPDFALVPARRNHWRLSLETEVGLSTESNFFTGYTENLSQGGVFVATHTSVPVGTDIALEIKLPGDVSVSITGRVRWLRGFNPSCPLMSPGMGMEFVDASDEELEPIRRFVELRETLFFDLEDL